ncbi:Fe-S cluster assembly protein SufD [Desulfogranum mediterraneum]|uniref:Fe-S cluster assembly protein SufD n=1 Tax=Desulfogranum mediterraneum TaxID=160661 RepID=UPI000429F519|nr:Fe-S cluster assembly protein SufD [Desulfogranum mediterraneum]
MIDRFLHYLSTQKMAEAQPRDWLAELRRQGRERLKLTAAPTTRDEEWRFTNINKFPTEQLGLHQSDRQALTSLSAADRALLARVRDEDATIPIIMVNGFLVKELSGSPQWPGGIRLSQVKTSLPSQGQEQSGLVKNASFRTADPFLLLNQAMMQRGIRLEIREGFEADRPIHIISLYTRASRAMVSSPRNFIVAGRESKAILLETTIWTGNFFSTDNCVKHLIMGEGAELEHVQYWQGHGKTYAISHTEAILKSRARYRTLVINGGSGMSRNNLSILLTQPHARVETSGISGLAGSGQVDNYSRIEHQASHTFSMQLYKGLFAGKSRGVFRGRIKVDKQVKGAEASQLNKNILLGKAARANSMPWLEIDASDIRCEHGATTGTLDKEQLFYLSSRGIPTNQARKLLLKAFMAEAFTHLTDPWLRGKIDEYCSSIFEQVINTHFIANQEGNMR